MSEDIDAARIEAFKTKCQELIQRAEAGDSTAELASDVVHEHNALNALLARFPIDIDADQPSPVIGAFEDVRHSYQAVKAALEYNVIDKQLANLHALAARVRPIEDDVQRIERQIDEFGADLPLVDVSERQTRLRERLAFYVDYAAASQAEHTQRQADARVTAEHQTAVIIGEPGQIARWLLLAHGATAATCLNLLPDDPTDGRYVPMLDAALWAAVGLLVAGFGLAWRISGARDLQIFPKFKVPTINANFFFTGSFGVLLGNLIYGIIRLRLIGSDAGFSFPWPS